MLLYDSKQCKLVNSLSDVSRSNWRHYKYTYIIYMRIEISMTLVSLLAYHIMICGHLYFRTSMHTAWFELKLTNHNLDDDLDMFWQCVFHLSSCIYKLAQSLDNVWEVRLSRVNQSANSKVWIKMFVHKLIPRISNNCDLCELLVLVTKY
jgi:hypothetical protein